MDRAFHLLSACWNRFLFSLPPVIQVPFHIESASAAGSVPLRTCGKKIPDYPLAGTAGIGLLGFDRRLEPFLLGFDDSRAGPDSSPDSSFAEKIGHTGHNHTQPQNRPASQHGSRHGGDIDVCFEIESHPGGLIESARPKTGGKADLLDRGRPCGFCFRLPNGLDLV